MKLDGICRICANKIMGNQRDRNIFMYMRGRYLGQLKLITGVELTRNQGLPEIVCERCFSELDLAAKFRERCIFSQKYLLDIIKKPSDQSTDHVELSPEPLDEQLIDADQLETHDDNEQYVCYQESKEEPQDLEEIEPDDDPAAAVMAAAEAAAEAAHQEDLQEQEMERAAKRRSNFFICDECGTLFHDAFLYTEHLNGHQNRRDMNQFFPCPECPQTFKKKALLKQHRTQAHLINRRFQCAICHEVFASLGAKFRHDKAHKNERPYPCLECGMNFSSVSELQNHCSTHSKQTRMFRCEPCNMDFTTRRGLVAHTKTAPHKRLAKYMQDEFDFSELATQS
ncbi:transcription factor Ouib [Drosophila mauritiana]|uniref:Transcription factor Ouib n=1 Tax=Drosophila mauritiana TaxID=7226 RepID=A0A6P8KTJ2_DROMA|nr:transcription factor Ouib [Drosophila mauritiana]